MKKLCHLAVIITAMFLEASAEAALTLEFFQANSANDTVLSGIPLSQVNLTAGGPDVFVQVAMHQTAPTVLLNAKGLFGFILKGVYDPCQAGSCIVPATIPGGNVPQAILNTNYTAQFPPDRDPFYTVGSETFPHDGNETNATAFVISGAAPNPVPSSPPVDLNGRILLATFALRAPTFAPTAYTSIIFKDNLSGLRFDFVSGAGDDLDETLFSNGTVYALPIVVTGTNNPVTIVVETTNDNGPCSLRQAILNANFRPGPNIIEISSNLQGAIHLTSGELPINSDLVINGPSAGHLTVSADNSSRVFNVAAGVVEIANLTMSNGLCIGFASGANGLGGGVFNNASLMLSNCTVVENRTYGAPGANGGLESNGFPGGSGLGGGIYNTGILSLVNCTLNQNESHGDNGGVGGYSNGDFGKRGGNGGQGLGGAVYNDGTLTVMNCTFSTNRVYGGTGGVGGDGGLAVGVGGRGGDADGAGVFNRRTAQLTHVTLIGGVAERGLGGASAAGSLAGVSHGSGVFAVTNATFLLDTLAAGNSLGTGGQAGNGPDISGVIVSQGYNLIGITNGSSGWTSNDLTGNSNAPFDPRIGPLRDNGGPTFTHALLRASPAIDKGRGDGLTTDQRGRARPYDFTSVANASGGDGSDIGAFELNPPRLNITRSAGNVVLSWPTNEAGYTLEATTNLNPVVIWTTVPGQYSVTNNPTGGAKFYRLRTP